MTCWGPQIQSDTRIKFSLWAPAAETVSLSLVGEPELIPMQPGPEGWHEVTTDRATPGVQYWFVLPNGMRVPDPASRFQPLDVTGPSQIIEPSAYQWKDAHWRGRSWHEAVLYELHIGSFTAAGTFRAAIDKLSHLRELGVTALEIMPVGDFPGTRNWGYDGTFWYAPESSYGRPEDLKALIDAAHQHGIMVLLDVIYNHFGPEGNYLSLYAPQFFTDRHQTPWGSGIQYELAPVRAFAIQNALYWLQEFHLDGLRLDAVHEIRDDSAVHLLEELAATVRAQIADRPVHLVLENEENESHRLARGAARTVARYTAQWNDDVHHALHTAATGEGSGYYADYRGDTQKLARALAEGFAFQGEVMPFRQSARGEPSAHLPPTAFIAFIQNHDQIGNRAFGDRLTRLTSERALKAIAATYLLLPQVPMLFMGEEWGSQTPFPFFCDFHGELAQAVREGRRAEFARFPEFADESARQRIPDPQSPATFASAKLDWQALEDSATARHWLSWYRGLLAARAQYIVPRLTELSGNSAQYEVLGAVAIRIRWRLNSGETLCLLANLSETAFEVGTAPTAATLWREGASADATTTLPAWSVYWLLRRETPQVRHERGLSALFALAARCGVECEYEDAHGEAKYACPDTLRAVLAGMGWRAETETQAAASVAELSAREWERRTPPVHVSCVSQGAPRLDLIVPSGSRRIEWSLTLEEGRQLSGAAEVAALTLLERNSTRPQRLEKRRLTLPGEIPVGYHRFSLADASCETSVIVSPGRCWTPTRRDAGQRHWGLAAQLYTVRSSRNWGIGDFSDLRQLISLTEAAGGDIVGINPLHALFPTQPAQASPYSPLSRLLLNVLYIDVAAVPELSSSAEAQRRLNNPAFQQRLTACRTSTLIDYPTVAHLKLTVLHDLYRNFVRHSARGRRDAFDAFRCRQSEAFELACVFQAVLERLVADDPRMRDVGRWPAELAHAHAPGVASFKEAQADRISELMWYQWLAEEQLTAAAGAASPTGIGLYRDLAVGADRCGAEPWIRPHAFAPASIGAPPDLFNPDGQNWGLPVPHPLAWRAEGYASFIETLRANMHCAGALRIDHAMGLQRLYWIPDGAPASEGTYVKYGLDDVLAILALESERQHCAVVGEDLGTVPRGFRHRMHNAGVLSYRVLFFERESDGAFISGEGYPPLSLAVLGNHDLPTLRGWWSAESTTPADRAQLCKALGLASSPSPDVDDVMVAAHEFLMRSSADIVLAQLDDLTREETPVNDPTGKSSLPNWQRSLSLSLEALLHESLLPRISRRAEGVRAVDRARDNEHEATYPRATSLSCESSKG